MAMDQLVGRAEELANLRARLADAGRGAGHLIVVTGPAGIGKTRLVEEVVAGTDMVVGWGRPWTTLECRRCGHGHEPYVTCQRRDPRSPRSPPGPP